MDETIKKEPKPGYLTSEFWQAVINQVAGLVCVMVAALVLEPDNPNAQLLIVSGLALMGVQGIGYGISRAIVKKASMPKVFYTNQLKQT